MLLFVLFWKKREKLGEGKGEEEENENSGLGRG